MYIHSAAGAAAGAAAVLLLIFSFCYVDTVCSLTTEYLDSIDYNYDTVRCCTTNEYVFLYTYLLPCSVLLFRCCLQLLLLATDVRDRTPDGKICSRGSLYLIPVFSFFSFEHYFSSTYPLAVLSYFQHRYV